MLLCVNKITMPELPEVETTLLGIKPHIIHQKITNVIVRHYGLRWPIPADIKAVLGQKVIKNVQRRGKYLFIRRRLWHAYSASWDVWQLTNPHPVDSAQKT